MALFRSWYDLRIEWSQVSEVVLEYGIHLLETTQTVTDKN